MAFPQPDRVDRNSKDPRVKPGKDSFGFVSFLSSVTGSLAIEKSLIASLRSRFIHRNDEAGSPLPLLMRPMLTLGRHAWQRIAKCKAEFSLPEDAIHSFPAALS
jgi:hypothetical protein